MGEQKRESEGRSEEVGGGRREEEAIKEESADEQLGDPALVCNEMKRARTTECQSRPRRPWLLH